MYVLMPATCTNGPSDRRAKKTVKPTHRRRAGRQPNAAASAMHPSATSDIDPVSSAKPSTRWASIHVLNGPPNSGEFGLGMTKANRSTPGGQCSRAATSASTVRTSIGVYSDRMLMRTPAISTNPPWSAMATTKVAAMITRPRDTRWAKCHRASSEARDTLMAVATM
jgi:hypothetical protein